MGSRCYARGGTGVILEREVLAAPSGYIRWVIPQGRPPRLDVAIGVTLALVIVVENLLVGDALVTSVVLAAVSALTLVWRRTAPFLTPAAVLLAIGYAARTGDVATFDAVSQILVWVVGPFSVGAYQARLWSLAGWAGWVLVSLAWLVALGEDFADLAFELILVTAPWIAGVVVRTQRERAHLANQRADEETRRTAVAAANERARIARELHDVGGARRRDHGRPGGCRLGAPQR